jgi:hypothetical protein
MKRLYYSGSATHPFFRTEYSQLKQWIDIIPSNPTFDQKISIDPMQRDTYTSVRKQKLIRIIL